MYTLPHLKCTDDVPIHSYFRIFFVVDQSIFFTATLQYQLHLYSRHDARRVFFNLLDRTQGVLC